MSTVPGAKRSVGSGRPRRVGSGGCRSRGGGVGRAGAAGRRTRLASVPARSVPQDGQKRCRSSTGDAQAGQGEPDGRSHGPKHTTNRGSRSRVGSFVRPRFRLPSTDAAPHRHSRRAHRRGRYASRGGSASGGRGLGHRDASPTRRRASPDDEHDATFATERGRSAPRLGFAVDDDEVLAPSSWPTSDSRVGLIRPRHCW